MMEYFQPAIFYAERSQWPKVPPVVDIMKDFALLQDGSLTQWLTSTGPPSPYWPDGSDRGYVEIWWDSVISIKPWWNRVYYDET